MSTVHELIQIVESAGGKFMIDGDRLGIVPATAAAPVLEELRRNKPEIIGLILERNAAVWRRPFTGWLNFTCARRPRDFAGLVCLHRSFVEWQAEHNDQAPDLAVFEALLVERGFLTGEVAGTKLVSGLAFRDDLESIRRFQRGAPQ